MRKDKGCRRQEATRGPGTGGPWAWVVGFLSLVVVVGGCATDTQRQMTTDPLLGGPPLRPTRPGASPPPASGAARTPAAELSSPTSTAVLAAGVPRPFDNGNDLRIGNPRSNPATGGWAGQGSATGGELSGALLRQPQPVVEPVAQRSPVPVAGGGPVGDSTGATYEQLQAQLTARGVVWQRQELNSETGEWRFSCLVPNRRNPNVRRMYEARARDYVAAIRTVLEQIEKEQ